MDRTAPNPSIWPQLEHRCRRRRRRPEAGSFRSPERYCSPSAVYVAQGWFSDETHCVQSEEPNLFSYRVFIIDVERIVWNTAPLLISAAAAVGAAASNTPV